MEPNELKPNVRETVIVKYVRRAKAGSSTRCVDLLLVSYARTKTGSQDLYMGVELLNYKAQKLLGVRISRKDETVMAQGVAEINSIVTRLMEKMGRPEGSVDILLI